jgi:uncharacterized protein (DUF885 family)
MVRVRCETAGSRFLMPVLLGLGIATQVFSQVPLGPEPVPDPSEASKVANAEDTSSVANWISRYSADIKTLDHRFRIPLDQQAYERRIQVAKGWLEKLAALDFAKLPRVSQIDYLLFRSELEYRIANLELEHKRDLEAAQLLPYSTALVTILRNRENVEPIEHRAMANLINGLAEEVDNCIATLTPTKTNPSATERGEEEAAEGETESEAKNGAVVRRLNGLRAVQLLDRLNRSLSEAHRFYSGYDPLYDWWMEKPMSRLQKLLKQHRGALQNDVVGVPESDKETIIGLPIGAEGLELELKHEWIAHTPAELVELAKREMAWCDAEMAAASQELGYGDDWRAAMEHVKSLHVDPGKQPQMIRDLAWEAIRFLEANDLLTVPPMAANGWRMTMMSPERQRLNPYFLGGDTIIVSFPTNTMTHDEKLMSMRSNNEHFSRATVHHELIPGHHLQYYMLPRYKPYRGLFRTPFWIEGWALYWEMLLWDLDFAQGPEDRVGMLFWRKHRCARIIFSLSYHLGTMSPEECVEYLVQRVGHERSAASRRSAPLDHGWVQSSLSSGLHVGRIAVASDAQRTSAVRGDDQL